MGVVVELGIDAVARPAGAPDILRRRHFGQRVAALDHKALDNAMETGAIVESSFGEFFEIGDRIRRGLGPESDDHLTLRGVDDSDFIGRRRSGQGVRVGIGGRSRCQTSDQTDGAN